MRAGKGLVVYRRTAPVDAIDAYSRRLVAALAQHGTPAEYVDTGLAAARRRAADPAWILLQYNPFSYGYRGIAPGLLRHAAGLRRAAGPPFAICVHEPWTYVHDWRSALMAAGHGAQLPGLLRSADVVLGVTERICRQVGHAAVHVPVGSNVAPLALPAAAARERLGIGDELVVALFGRDHPSRALDHAAAAIAALTENRPAGAIRVLNLGFGAPPLDVPRGVAVDSPGHLEAEALSVRLRASDLVLLPFVEGLSTRRTTLMAALAHGLPVASLRGASTDSVLIDHPEAIVLTQTGRPDAYARAVAELAADPERRRAAGDAGRRLYEKRFDWPVLAAAVTSALERAGAGRRPRRRR